MIPVLGAVAGALFQPGGVLDDLFFGGQHVAEAKAKADAAQAQLQLAQEATKQAQLKAAANTRLALLGLGGVGLLTLGVVASAAVRD